MYICPCISIKREKHHYREVRLSPGEDCNTGFQASKQVAYALIEWALLFLVVQGDWWWPQCKLSHAWGRPRQGMVMCQGQSCCMERSLGGQRELWVEHRSPQIGQLEPFLEKFQRQLQPGPSRSSWANYTSNMQFNFIISEHKQATMIKEYAFLTFGVRILTVLQVSLLLSVLACIANVALASGSC